MTENTVVPTASQSAIETIESVENPTLHAGNLHDYVPTSSDLAHIDVSVINLRQYKPLEINQALLFRQRLLEQITLPAAQDDNSEAKQRVNPRYQAFFYACLILRHINNYGLNDDQAQAVKQFFKGQATRFQLDKETLNKYFILSPLILNTVDYEQLGKPENVEWLIGRCLRALNTTKGYVLTFPIDSIANAIKFLEHETHDISSIFKAYQGKEITNAWAYTPGEIAQDNLILVLNSNSENSNLPLLTLMLKKAEEILQQQLNRESYISQQLASPKKQDGKFLAVQALIDSQYEDNVPVKEKAVRGRSSTVVEVKPETAPPQDADQATSNQQHDTSTAPKKDSFMSRWLARFNKKSASVASSKEDNHASHLEPIKHIVATNVQTKQQIEVASQPSQQRLIKVPAQDDGDIVGVEKLWQFQKAGLFIYGPKKTRPQIKG